MCYCNQNLPNFHNLRMNAFPETYVADFHNINDVKKMKYLKFGNTGISVSQISLGTAGFSYVYGDYTLEECKATVHAAIKSGINYIDTGPWYGHGVSEENLGKCLEGVPRKAYYLATKVGRYEKDPKKMFDFTAEKTRKSIDDSLKRLGVEYVDILQVHDVEFAPSIEIILNETLPTVQQAVDNKKARFVGITGYPVSVIAEIIEKSPMKIDMVLSYARFTLIDDTLKNYLPLFGSKRLGIVNAAAHSMGLLSNRGPQQWHPAPEEIKKVSCEARDYCKQHNVELGKLALHYSTTQPGPHTNLVGINTMELLKINLDVYHNGLNEKEAEVLDYVKNKILSKLSVTHWENIELEQYKVELNK